MNDINKINPFFDSIKEIVNQARLNIYRSSNSILLKMYWEIGKLIVENQQEGNAKAEYGKAVLKNLAHQLIIEFGKGFDERNLNNIRAFFSHSRFGTQCVPN